MNFIPEKLRSESILDFLKNETVIAMKETQFKSVVRSKLNLDEKNTKESLEIICFTVSFGLFQIVYLTWLCLSDSICPSKVSKTVSRPYGKYERKFQN